MVDVTGGHRKIDKKNKIIFMSCHFCHIRGIDREPQECPPLDMGCTLAVPTNLQSINTPNYFHPLLLRVVIISSLNSKHVTQTLFQFFTHCVLVHSHVLHGVEVLN